MDVYRSSGMYLLMCLFRKLIVDCHLRFVYRSSQHHCLKSLVGLKVIFLSNQPSLMNMF